MTLSFECPVLCTALVDSSVITSDDQGRLLHTSVDELQRREVASAHSRSVLAIAQSEGAEGSPGFYVTVGSDERVVIHRQTGEPVYTTQFTGLGDLLCVCIARCAASKAVHIFMGSQSTKVIGMRFVETHLVGALQGQSKDMLKPSAVHVYSGHFGFVYSCCTMPWDSTSIATAGGDSTLLQWGINMESQQLQLRGRCTGHTGSVYCSAAHGGNIFTGSQDCTLRVWDQDTLACQHVLVGHPDSVLTMTVLHRSGFPSVLVSACASGQMRLWCLSTFTNLAVVDQAHDAGSYVLCLCAHQLLNGHLVQLGLLSGGTDGTLRLWDMQQLLQQQEEQNGTEPLTESSQVIAGSRGGGLHTAGQLRSSSSVSSLGELLLSPEQASPPKPPSPLQRLPASTESTSGAPVITRTHGDMSVWRGAEDLQPLAFSARAGGGQYTLQDVVTAFESSKLPPLVQPTSPLQQPAIPPGAVGGSPPSAPKCSVELDKNTLVKLLTSAVSIPSVSSDSELRPKCWVAARFMQRFLGQLGAQVRLVQVVSGTNPVVLGKLTCPNATATVVIHGHYDVQPAGGGGPSPSDNWATDPFVLTGRDGYLYGRGASDNKGSLLAAIFAAARAFYVDHVRTSFVFLVEGEGENGSAGFREAIQWNREWFAGASLVLNTNNVWLDEETPCLTYGMRGLLKLELQVSSSDGGIDRHAGTDGGHMHVEPMMDLVAALARLVDTTSGKVSIDGFYEAVKAPADEGGVVQAAAGGPTDTERRWASPSLTVHRIHSSSMNDTVIPHSASSVISIRLVPDQAPSTVASQVIQHLLNGHAQRGGSNVMTVRVVSSADWWLADHTSPHYRAAADAISDVWGRPPRFVREGGTMRVTPFLQSELGAPAMHVPIGQASDGAHQINERISLRNLWNGVRVLQSMFSKLSKPETASTTAP